MSFSDQQKDYLKSFRNFVEKCPLYLDVQPDDEKITIRGISFKKGEFSIQYTWDEVFSTPKREFIYKFKTFVKKYYPVLIETQYEIKTYSPEELAIKAEMEKDITKIPSVQKIPIRSYKWVVDKVVVWENILMLRRIPNDGNHYKFKFNKILRLFLKKMRNGFWKDEKELGDYFFNNSSLITQENSDEKKIS